MKLQLSYYDKMVSRPFNKFFLNLFSLKNNSYFILKQLLYIYLFLNVKKILKIKILKFNYNFYKKFIKYFISLNIIFQIFLLITI